MTDENVAQVVSLHQADLHSGRVANLAELSAEQAATALVEAFQRTGYAEAIVSDLEHTRDLVRRDCRRRRGCSRSLIYQLIATRALRAVKVGRRTLIPRAELQRWVQSLPPAT